MIELKLSTEMVAVIGGALAEQPFKQVAAVISELQKQIDAQQKPQAEPEPSDGKDK